MAIRLAVMFALMGAAISAAQAERYVLLTGVDARHYPGSLRHISPSPGPGYPGDFYDGDRLAGTSDVSAGVVPFYGSGTPMFAPNQFGSLSMLYRRGSVPAGGSSKLPLMGIEFLGGPLLDLDGDLQDGVRSLIPVDGATPVTIPLTSSYIELGFDLGGGTVQLLNIDSTGCNEGGPQISAGTATILITRAGTGPTGTLGPAINPGVDTRVGSVAAFSGNSGTLAGVYRVQNLGYEFWEDSIDPASSTANVLGTMQFLGALRGWLVERNAATGAFPTLAGEGLGPTLWPSVDVSQVGQVFNTANGLAGGSATVTNGLPQDQFSAVGNGGLALTDFGGDLGAYLDSVVTPLVPLTADRFVYLESAGFGINNSFDPVYMDTVAYDVVLIAAADRCLGYLRGDANCDGVINNQDINPFVFALFTTDPAAYEAKYPGCSYLCNCDLNGDGAVNNLDINPFVAALFAEP